MSRLLDLNHQLAFYASYHHNEINKYVHIVFVPTILFTAQVFFTYTPIFAEFGGIVINAAFILSAIYAVYYVLLEPIAGTIFGGIVMLGYYYALEFVATVENAWMWAILIHVVSWVAQIGSHQVFEGRKPALFDSLIQSFVLAPLFVWLEVLFMFGYRPELAAEVDKKAVANIKAWKESQAAKSR